jgi:hypothetical protein
MTNPNFQIPNPKLLVGSMEFGICVVGFEMA